MKNNDSEQSYTDYLIDCILDEILYDNQDLASYFESLSDPEANEIY